jgi:HEAT repeat protein
MDFRLDKLSFWIGFAAGGIVVFLLGRLRPWFNDLKEAFSQRFTDVRAGLSASIELRYRQDVVRLAQESHLAAPLFSLDEIVIQPRFMSPPPYVMPEETLPPDDVYSVTLSYMPEWPELAALYKAPTLTLQDVLSGGANLALISNPGNGKTVTLNYLAAQVARRDSAFLELNDPVPVLVHAAELQLPAKDDNLTETLYYALYEKVSTLVEARLPKFLETIFDRKIALLLVDGIDELPPEQQDQVVEYISMLNATYPGNRMLIALSPEYLPELKAIDMIPITLAGWDQRTANRFIHKWAEIWNQYPLVETWSQALPEKPEDFILTGWLTQETRMLSPLAVTLKTWSVFAGDTLGSTIADSIEAYVRRMTANTANAQQALEQLATQMIITAQPILQKSEAGSQVAEFESSEDALEEISPTEDSGISKRKVKQLLPELEKSKLIVFRPGSMVSFANPTIMGYLAAGGIAKGGGGEILQQPNWTGKSLALEFLAAKADISRLVSDMFANQKDDALRRKALTTGRWASHAPTKASWRASVMRGMAAIINDSSVPLGIRLRSLIALINTGDPVISQFFHQLIKAERHELRAFGALGLGAVQDEKAVYVLEQLLDDPAPIVNRAAGLGLVAIDTKQALDAASRALLEGNEEVQRAVAEAFATHPEEGHAILQDGAHYEPNLLVRRAVVYGLAHINEPWSIELLKEIQVEDDQWIVRSAATEALEKLEGGNPHIPKALPPLFNTPWLIAFASRRGTGVPPGEGAWDILQTALKEGNADEQLAAMYLYRTAPQRAKDSIPQLIQLLYSNEHELQDGALQTLWYMQAAGIDLPPPTVFGFG